mmetsp:Transcript_75649/g.119216  ORF Transcript_75649/g.119216 Transcript_75649/m.119216 type:complete len:229 (+) Transcript_75649:1504-2190(+)
MDINLTICGLYHAHVVMTPVTSFGISNCSEVRRSDLRCFQGVGFPTARRCRVCHGAGEDDLIQMDLDCVVRSQVRRKRPEENRFAVLRSFPSQCTRCSVMSSVLLESLQISRHDSNDFLRVKMLQALTMEHMVEVFGDLIIHEIQEREASIRMTARVHRQIEEVVPAKKAGAINLPHQFPLRVLARDVSNHDRSASAKSASRCCNVASGLHFRVDYLIRCLAPFFVFF